MSIRKKRILAGFALAILLLIVDVLRMPENQLSGGVYIGAVHLYQYYGRPMLDGVVACRYRPTCSDYSIEAVEQFGIVRGLYLTLIRVYSCDSSVPMGTVDLPT